MRDISKIAALILGPGEEPGMEESFYDMQSKDLAKDILMAIEEKNALALASSLKAFIAACEMTEGD